MTAAIKACFRGDQNKIHNNKESKKLGQSDKESESDYLEQRYKECERTDTKRGCIAYLVRPPNGYWFLMAGPESQ